MPPLTIFANPRHRRPRRVATLTNRIEEIRYKHREDGKWYKHQFKPGASIQLLDNGDAVIERKDGKPVWMDDGSLDSGRDDVHFLTNPKHGAKRARSSRRRRHMTKTRRPVSRNRPKKRRTDMARRKRNAKGRFVKSHATTKRRRRRTATVTRMRSGRKRARRAAVTHLNPRRRRRYRLGKAYGAKRSRSHRRHYRHNPSVRGFTNLLKEGFVGGAGVVIGQQITRKGSALFKQYIPGQATATGFMTLISPLAAATIGSFIADKFAKKLAPFIVAGAFSEVINLGLAQTPAASYLSAYPQVVSLRAWPQPKVLPSAAPGVRAWPGRAGTVREVG